MAAVKVKKRLTFGEQQTIADEEKRLEEQFQEDRDFIASKSDELQTILAKLVDPANADVLELVLEYDFTHSNVDSSVQDLSTLVVSEDVFALQYAAGEAALKAVAHVQEGSQIMRYGVMSFLTQNRLCDGTWSPRSYNGLTNPLRVFLTVVDNSEAGSAERSAYCELIGGETGREVIMDLHTKETSIEEAVKAAFGALRV